jgi:hypothetical protein
MATNWEEIAERLRVKEPSPVDDDVTAMDDIRYFLYVLALAEAEKMAGDGMDVQKAIEVLRDHCRMIADQYNPDDEPCKHEWFERQWPLFCHKCGERKDGG